MRVINVCFTSIEFHVFFSVILKTYEFSLSLSLLIESEAMTIIAFISQKGGVGKSTLAQALAVEAKKQEIKVLLADCDFQQGTSDGWAKVKKEIECRLFNQVKDI